MMTCGNREVLRQSLKNTSIVVRTDEMHCQGLLCTKLHYCCFIVVYVPRAELNKLIQSYSILLSKHL